MPEYLAPGVYVEETSFRGKSIEGVGTSTTAFVGPTRKGPIGGTPEIVTSFGDFANIYGGLGNLDFGAGPVPNYIAHAVRVYFTEGGSRLYVSRASAGGAAAVSEFLVGDGAANEADRARFIARTAGGLGNGELTLRLLDTPATLASMRAAPNGSMLRVLTDAGDLGTATYHVKRGDQWFASDADDAEPLDTSGLGDGDNPGARADLLTLSVETRDGDDSEQFFDELGFERTHPRWVGNVLAVNPTRRVDALQNTYALEVGENITGLALHGGMFPANAVERTLAMTGGADGGEPGIAAYNAALAALTRLDDISVVAAPGHSTFGSYQAVQGALIAHVSRRRAYETAVLDTPPDQTVGEARAERARVDSIRAAMYYPWVVIGNPLARPGDERADKEITLPPSGFICGVFARNDVERGVHKAPANEVVRTALRFESDINFGEQEVLNPLGVNCLRYFPGRGYRVWGARLASSDPEWKYVSDRRYFNYLEASIDRSTQWAVFEPNGPRLWAVVRETIGNFLYNEWREGRLLGANTDEAYFVRCDRSTMTQADLDNGRMICLIGVAIIRPAEFVIFRIGQKTADARS